MIQQIRTRDGLLNLVEVITEKYVNTLDVYNSDYYLICSVKNCTVKTLSKENIRYILDSQEDFDYLCKLKINEN